MNRAEPSDRALDEHFSPLQLSIYADGETPAAEREQVAAHLAACAACAERLESIRAVGVTLARLERTTPSARVFERTMEAARRFERAPGGVGRERLGGARRGAIRLREVRFPDAEITTIAPRGKTPGGPRRRARWRIPTSALATIAALLLIALASGLLMRGSESDVLPNVSPTPIVTLPPGQVMAATRQAISAHTIDLTFTPVAPTYLPPGASLPIVKITPLGGGVNALDITWTVSGSAAKSLTLREQPATRPDDAFPYPQTTPQGVTLAWQVASAPGWSPMRRVAGSGWIGVEQRRSNVVLQFQAQLMPGARAAQAATPLRFVSLAMDAPYLPLKAPIQAPPASDALRTIASVQGPNGRTWSWDVTQSVDRVYQDATITDPATHAQIEEITGPGGAGVLLNKPQRVYQQIAGPTAHQSHSPSLTVVGLAANTFLQTGQLWNLGVTTVHLPDGNQINAYDLYRVDTSKPEHVYADVTTGAVVAISIDTGSRVSPGGDGSDAPYVDDTSCAPYVITYQWLLFVASPTFDTQPPQQGWTPGAVTLPFTCGA